MSEWKTYRLEELCTAKGSYGIGAPAVAYDANKYTYLRITDINDDGTLNRNGLMSVDDEHAEDYILKENDIVFARTGNSTGRTYFYDGQDGELVYAGFLIKFSLDSEKVNPRILKYYTHSQPYYNWVRSFDTGGTRGNINAKVFGAMPITLPPRRQQDRIVEILKPLDDKIELNRRINANLEAQAQALFRSWFVDFEPFRDGPFVDSELGKIPQGWKVVELQTLVTIKRGGSPRPIQNFLSDSGYNWLKISDATSEQSPYIYDIKEHIKESGLNKTVYIKSGELVLSNSATPGIPKMLGVDSCIHDGWLYFPKSALSNEFLYLLFKENREKFLSQGNGSVFLNLKTDILKSFKIIIPNNLDELKEFNIILHNIFQEIKYKTEEIKTLSTLRDTLLPKLMAGEIKI